MAKKGDTRTEKELREEFFDGPASDIMTFPQFLMQQGRGDLVEPMKTRDVKGMADGGVVEMVRGDPNYYKDLL